MAEIGMNKTVRQGYDEVLAKLPELLQAEGFGVLTRIDVKKTLKEKIGADFRRYEILGACNPKLAHQALQAEPAIGVMLPCNVTVYEADDGATVVTAVDPLQTMAAADPRLEGMATEVRARLSRGLEGLA
jgi:uncharacterized protein (DUF302 family)